MYNLNKADQIEEMQINEIPEILSSDRIPKIIQVYSHNLKSEMTILSDYLKKYTILSIVNIKA